MPETDATPSPMLAACNPIPDDLASWADAPFPIAAQSGVSNVMLLCAVGQSQQIVGFLWYGDTPETAWSIQTLNWHPNGAYGSSGNRGEHESMDLPPPPAAAAVEADRLRGEIAEIEQRLAAYPDAPPAWTERDRSTAKRLQTQLDRLVPPVADEAEATEPPAAPSEG